MEFDDDNHEGITVTARRDPSTKITAPNAITPTYAALDFDPNGPGEWDVVKQHPFAAIPAGAAGLYARFMDKPDNYTGNFHNDDADAYRHARWSQMMTQSIGPDLAKQFSDAHEISAPDPNGERLMDLYNNQVGRGLSPGRNQVEGALQRGILRTSPFKQ
jgi:hypothetical protein